MTRPIARTALCGILVAAAPAVAQATRLDRDVDFVRKLAKELRFIDLAKLEVERLTQKHRESDKFKQVFQLGVEISLIGARSHPNREERRTLFRDALERSKDFVQRYPNEAVADQARLTMVEACYEFGRFLLDEITLAAETDPGKVKELEEIAAGVYRDGVDACNKVMEARRDYEGQPESQQYQELFRAWYFKGILLRENARAVERDRVPLAQMARDTLEEMIFEYGEGTVLGLRGFFDMAQISEVLGKIDTAITDYKDTIASIHKTLTDETLEIPPAAQEALFHLMQEAYDRAAEAMFVEGRIQDVLDLAQAFRAHLREFGQKGVAEFDIAHPQYGHPVFLTEARAMAESGDTALVRKALEQAQVINDKHPSDIIGLKAKAVLKDILDIQSDLVDGALLYEVAKGDYQSREYELANKNFKRAYAAMSPEQRQKNGLELWTTFAKSLGAQRRYLEATLASCLALELHGGHGTPEPTADVLERAWQGFQRDSQRDESADLEPLRERVVTLLGQYGGAGSEAKLLWRDANRQFSDRAYVDAAATYAKIPADTTLYEPAQGRLVASWFLADRFQEARAAATEFHAWLVSDKARIPDDRSDLRINRARTLAALEFYEAAMDYREAVGEVGGSKDATRFEPTIAKLQKFLGDHKQHGEIYVPGVYDMIARLYAMLGRIDKAEEFYRTLRSEQPNSDRVPRLATQIFDSHNERVKSVSTEYDALVARSAPEAEVRGAKQRLDEARRAALASAVDYVRNSTDPQYAVLWNALQLARDLNDWSTAESIGRKTVELYEGNAENGEKVEKFVKPIVGESYLRQKRFREAADLLAAADAAAEKSGTPNYPVKRLLALARGGWFEFDERSNLVEISGLDQPIPAYEAFWNDYRRYALNEARGSVKYGYEWYEYYFELYSFAKRASRSDNAYQQTATTCFRIAQSTDDFQTLRKLGPQGQRLWQLFQAVKNAR